ncbi:hypothetical protein DM790_10560 [Flavobacterium collinsii]|nr:hypothetical protein [Flavobacterium collinsii]
MVARPAIYFYNFSYLFTQPFKLCFTTRYNLKGMKMKKIVILILGLFTVACSNDAITYSDYELDKPLDPNIEISYTITKRYYNDQNINNDTEKFYFSEEKIVLYLKNNGYYFKYKYNNNLLSEIQGYDPRNTVISSTKFVYDNLERIIEIDDLPNTARKNETTKYSLVYDLDKITAIEKVSYPEQHTRTYEFKINGNNQIISYDFTKMDEKEVPKIYLKQFSYENGNLISLNDLEISYGNVKNDYNFKKNLFGKEWKKNNFITNYLLRETFVTNAPQSEISDYLISSSKQKLDNNVIYDVKVDYEFNNQNKITKEIRKYNFTANGATKDGGRTEFIYEYN